MTRIILVMFLLMWILIGSFALDDFSKHAEMEGIGSILPFLFGWGVGTLFVLVAAAWNIAGMERVILDKSEMKHRREIFGLGFDKEYAAQHLGKFRVGGGSALRLAPGMEVWGMGPGVVSFDYGVKTYRFGSTLEDSEAEQIVTTLQAQLNSFRTTQLK
ncbi:MAG TPA: hypothetical protein VFV17_07340 [Usitatibacteraceae bacterium]|nr:hypothetical protein [Usitatibacteraceae bacterium]